MSSDDDMPPPLEDMGETLQAQKRAKEKAEGNLHYIPNKTSDHDEFQRVAPKKENVSKIASSDFDDKP